MTQDDARDLAPGDFGSRLRELRRSNKMSRSQLARASGLSRRNIAALERGRAPISDADVDALANACGVEVTVLAPPVFRLTTGSGASDPGSGELRGQAASDGLLREYVSMLFELRDSRRLSPASLRQEDLSELALALGGTPEAIEARIVELLGTDEEQAWELRTEILPSLRTTS
jgi:transcriptional regulator with XRE-family HTH domain